MHSQTLFVLLARFSTGFFLLFFKHLHRKARASDVEKWCMNVEKTVREEFVVEDANGADRMDTGREQRV